MIFQKDVRLAVKLSVVVCTAQLRCLNKVSLPWYFVFPLMRVDAGYLILHPVHSLFMSNSLIVLNVAFLDSFLLKSCFYLLVLDVSIKYSYMKNK